MIKPLTFIVSGNDTAAVGELQRALTDESRARVLEAEGDIERLGAEVARLRPSVAMVVLGTGSSSTLVTVARVAAASPETIVICASRDSSPDIILNSLRAGAREFLRLPLDLEEFRTVFDRTAAFFAQQTGSAKKRGRLVAIFSAKGGCGTSLIAANLAASIKAPTALVDLDLQAGDLDITLGAKPRYSVVDVVKNRARLDDALLANYLVSHSDNLAFLAAPQEAAHAEDVRAEDVPDVLELLRSRYDYVVADLQHTFDAVTLAALDNADDVLLVLTLEIPAIRSAQRALALFDRLGYPRSKVRVVINRWTKHADLESKQVERFLGERVLGYVHNDYRLAANSINLGQPLVETAPTSAVATSISQIAVKLLGSEVVHGAAEAGKGLLGSIFRRQTTPPKTSDVQAKLGQSLNDLQRSES